MKRMISLLLTALMILSLAPGALAIDKTGYAVITADNPTDRLNLRKSASADSDSLGRYYIGTRVHIIGEKGEFTKVEIGEGDAKAAGYMLTKYLIPETENANYASDVFYAQTKSAGELLDSPSAGGKVIDTFEKHSRCYILGDVGDDWRHVRMNGEYGYVRASRLYEKSAYIWRAYLKADDSGVVSVYESESLSARRVANFLSDTAVEITALDKNGWASVNIMGMGDLMPGSLAGLSFSGCVQTKYLNINDPDLSERVVRRPSDLNVVEMTRNVMAYEINGLRGSDYLMEGAAAAAIGYCRDKDGTDRVIIEYGGALGAVPLDATTGTDRHVEFSALPTIGYGYVVNTDDGYAPTYLHPTENTDDNQMVDQYAAGEILPIKSQLAQFYQLDEFACTYIASRHIRYYALSDLLSGTAGSFDAGDYQAGDDLRSALYTLKNGRATVTYGDRTKTYETIGDCTFYLPAGATLTIERGTLVPADQTKLVTQDREQASDVSGRYFVGTQMVSRRHWDYQVRAAAGAESAYYVISTLINDDLTQDITREEIRSTLEPGETYTISVYEGETIEFFHCDVEVFYGNG